jgi:DNA polymerase
LWRGYYRSIFNPARVKVRAMQSEMPKKYWKNLPEARLIQGLIADSGRRVHEMLETEGLPARPKVIKPYPDA